MYNNPAFPLQQFRQKLTDTQNLKKQLQPWMQQFLRPNMEWNFAIISEIHRIITTKLENIVIKFSGLCTIRILLDTCSIPLVNLIQCYLVNPIMQIALYKCTDNTPERGLRYFIDNGHPQDTPDVEKYGFNYVKLATQLLIVSKDIKPKKLFEDEQMEGHSMFTLAYKNLLTKGLTPLKTLQFYKPKKPEQLRNNFIKNLQQFNNQSINYTQFFVKATSSLIENGFNQNYSILDIRKMLISGDLYVSTASLEKIQQYLDKSHNLKHKTNALLLLNQFVKVADFEAYYNVIETKTVKDIAAKILTANGNHQEKPKSIYPEIKGQIQDKQQFYFQFVKCVHLWSECYPVDLLLGKGVTKIKQIYEKMKASQVKFPNQQIEQFKKRYLQASKVNQERNERLKEAYLPDDVVKQQQPKPPPQQVSSIRTNSIKPSSQQLNSSNSHSIKPSSQQLNSNKPSSIKPPSKQSIQMPIQKKNVEVKQSKTNSKLNVRPGQQHSEVPIKVYSMKNKIIQAVNLLKEAPKNSKQLIHKMSQLVEFKGQFENYVLKSQQSQQQQQTQKLLEKGYQVIDRVQKALPLYFQYKNGQSQLFPNICMILTDKSGIFVDYQPLKQSQWPKNTNKENAVQIPTKNHQTHQLQIHKYQSQTKIIKKQPIPKLPIKNHDQSATLISQTKQGYHNVPIITQTKFVQNKRIPHQQKVDFEQSSNMSESNLSKNQKKITSRKQMFESPINQLEMNFNKKNRIEQNQIIQLDDKIQQPQITPLDESFHDMNQLKNTLKQNPKPTFKSCFNDKYIYGKDNKTQKLYWLENDSINLIKGNKRNPSGSKISVPQLLQERNNKFQTQIQYIEKQKQKTIRLLEKKIERLESTQQNLKRQVQNKDKQIRLFKQKSDISESGQNHKNYIEDQYYLFKNKVTNQNTTPLKYYNSQLNQIQPCGKIIPLKSYQNLFFQFQNYKEKKTLLKHKDLILKTDYIEIGCMSYRENSILVLNLYITPVNYIQQVKCSITGQSGNNLEIKYYPEKIQQIRAKKQQKVTFQIAINNFQYMLPYFSINYIQNYQRKSLQFLLPCSFHKFVQIQSVQSRQINSIMAQKKVVRGEEVPYSKKMLKDIKQILQYFPHMVELDERGNQIGQKTFGGKCSFGKNIFYIRICVKLNQFLYVQGVHIIGNQKLMQFYICLVTYLLNKKID